MIKAVIFDLDNTLVKIKDCTKYIGTDDILKYLKEHRYKLCILSDAPEHKVMYRLKKANILHYFDIIVTFNDTNVKKPNHKPFFHILKKLNLYPHEVMMVGDNLEKDILGANNVLMNTCLIKRNGIVPDYTIKYLKDLKRIL